eukprot:463805-Prorocentrum_lima.AAC.1
MTENTEPPFHDADEAHLYEAFPDDEAAVEVEDLQLDWEWERFDEKATHFVLSKKREGPIHDAVVARTTINLDTSELYEEYRIILGEAVPDLLGPLPLPKG